MLFCDSLSDPKKRAKFERYGTIETEELVLIHSPHYVHILTALQADSGPISVTSQLGWFTTSLFYTLVFVAMPMSTVYHYAHLVKSSEDRLSTAVSNAESIHKVQDWCCLQCPTFVFCRI